MPNTANQDQADYWSSESAQKWITLEAELDIILENINRELIRQGQPTPAERILDIGCGTGATSRSFADHLVPGGSITAIDISARLLDQAIARKATQPIDIHYALMDAQTADIPGGSFDLVVSRFGVMFFDDPVRAFQNIRRHMKPGGRMVLACWAAMSANPWFSLPAAAATDHFGPMPPTDPDTPGPLAFQKIPKVEQILQKAGFSSAKGTPTDVTLHHPGPLETVTNIAVNLGPTERIMRHYQGSASDLTQIRKAILAKLETFQDSTGINLPAKLNFYTATNPN